MPTPIQLSKFGSRIAALVIDILVLALIGTILGFTLQDFFIGLGAYGIFVGVTISVLYFTLQNYRYFKGQTIGKRAFDIQVTDKEGNLLSLQRSFARAVILCVPYFFVNAEFPGLHTGSVIYLLKSIVCLTLVFGVMQFYLFNKGTRQSLHDLLVGSYVVSTERLPEPATLPAVTKASYYVFGIVAMFLVVFTVVGISQIRSNFPDLFAVQDRISNIDGVINAGVTKSISTVYGEEGSTTKSIKVQLWVEELPANLDELENVKQTRAAIKAIIELKPNFDEYDIISITLTRGFNIGISSWKSSFSCQKTPGEWRKVLQGE